MKKKKFIRKENMSFLLPPHIEHFYSEVLLKGKAIMKCPDGTIEYLSMDEWKQKGLK